MKRYIVLIVLFVFFVEVRAQFDAQIGQYMYMPTAFNPAAVGEGDLMKVSGLHRMSFTGIKNAPMTTYFCFGSPFLIGQTHHGVGVRFLNDRYGLYTNMTFHVQYAYRQKLGRGYLSGGVDLGFVSVGFKGDSTNLKELTDAYHDANDTKVPNSSEAGMNFDMGVGIYYTTSSWYAGISYSHITNPLIHWGEYSTVRLKGTMYVMGGYNVRFKSNKEWCLKPSAMLMTDFTSWDLDLTAMCEYKEKWRWGLAYRVMSGVSVLLGCDIINGLQVGYTYELPTNKMLLESFGSHEIYLSYGFNVLKPKRTNKYKSVRYL